MHSIGITHEDFSKICHLVIHKEERGSTSGINFPVSFGWYFLDFFGNIRQICNSILLDQYEFHWHSLHSVYMLCDPSYLVAKHHATEDCPNVSLILLECFSLVHFYFGPVVLSQQFSLCLHNFMLDTGRCWFLSAILPLYTSDRFGKKIESFNTKSLKLEVANRIAKALKFKIFLGIS